MKVKIPYGHSFVKREEVLRCSRQTGSTVQAAGSALMPTQGQGAGMSTWFTNVHCDVSLMQTVAGQKCSRWWLSREVCCHLASQKDPEFVEASTSWFMYWADTYF